MRRRRAKRVGKIDLKALSTTMDSVGISGGDLLADANPAGREVYAPPPHKIIPPGGAWVGITRPLPPITGGGDLTVLPGRAFWAERAPGADASGRLPDRTFKARIVGLLCGDVYVWPYEYAILGIDELLDGWLRRRLRFVPLNVELARATDVCFYARSRGIALLDAAAMALGALRGPVGYFDNRLEIPR